MMIKNNAAKLKAGAKPDVWAHADGSAHFGTLCDHRTGETLRPATEAEQTESREAAERDGGAGVILVDGRRCYVQD